MSIKIEQIQINKYRSLESVDLNFEDSTLLLGKNNSGKSNIIRAIELAFTYQTVHKEDFYVSPSEGFSYDKKIIIDVKIIPYENGVPKKEFDEIWGRKFGDSISVSEETDDEFFAFRTLIEYDRDRDVFTNTKYIIDMWNDNREHNTGAMIKRETLSGFDLVAIPAQRDISNDIRDRKSIWGRLVSKIKISAETESKIQRQLDKLNEKIVSESDLLKSIAQELKDSTAESDSSIKISPLTKDVESLYKGMDIIYTEKNSLPTSVDNLGLGVRSWAVFSTVKAEISSKEQKADEDDLAYYPIVLVEEPEAHVHPQSQRFLFSVLNAISGQKVITTHSPYILSQADLGEIRYIYKEKSHTLIKEPLISDLTKDDVRKIRRTVINTRGEILFSNIVILAEGETEEQALTVFFRCFFDKEPFELGINIIGVGGGDYLPFLKILKKLGIKWFIFSDGEPEALDNLKKCLKKLDNKTRVNLDTYSDVVYLEDGLCFETYCLHCGYQNEIENAVSKCEDREEYITWYLENHNNQKGRGGIIRNYKNDNDGGIYRATKDCLLSGKTKYATYIAEEIINCENEENRIPPKIKVLFEKTKAFLFERFGE